MNYNFFEKYKNLINMNIDRNVGKEKIFKQYEIIFNFISFIINDIIPYINQIIIKYIDFNLILDNELNKCHAKKSKNDESENNDNNTTHINKRTYENNCTDNSDNFEEDKLKVNKNIILNCKTKYNKIYHPTKFIENDRKEIILSMNYFSNLNPEFNTIESKNRYRFFQSMNIDPIGYELKKFINSNNHKNFNSAIKEEIDVTNRNKILNYKFSDLVKKIENNASNENIDNTFSHNKNNMEIKKSFVKLTNQFYTLPKYSDNYKSNSFEYYLKNGKNNTSRDDLQLINMNKLKNRDEIFQNVLFKIRDILKNNIVNNIENLNEKEKVKKELNVKNKLNSNINNHNKNLEMNFLSKFLYDTLNDVLFTKYDNNMSSSEMFENYTQSEDYFYILSQNHQNTQKNNNNNQYIKKIKSVKIYENILNTTSIVNSIHTLINTNHINNYEIEYKYDNIYENSEFLAKMKKKFKNINSANYIDKIFNNKNEFYFVDNYEYFIHNDPINTYNFMEKMKIELRNISHFESIITEYVNVSHLDFLEHLIYSNFDCFKYFKTISEIKNTMQSNNDDDDDNHYNDNDDITQKEIKYGSFMSSDINKIYNVTPIEYKNQMNTLKVNIFSSIKNDVISFTKKFNQNFKDNDHILDSKHTKKDIHYKNLLKKKILINNLNERYNTYNNNLFNILTILLDEC
jgi:hypothetical protein